MRGHIEREMGILEEWKERYPAEVSGGELQRFSIARALGQRDGDPSGRRDYGYAGSDHPETDLERPFKRRPRAGGSLWWQ
ncbi:MAG: hypothetical protein ACLUD2_20890 [Clostridium sp.]